MIDPVAYLSLFLNFDFFLFLNLGDFFLGSFKYSFMCIKTSAGINL